MGQTSVERLDVLQTSFPPLPSWIQDGDAGNDVIQDLGRVFRPLLRRRRKMAALPLPVAILDDLISGFPQMRSSKMATGSGRAAILRRRRNRGRKTRPILLARRRLPFLCSRAHKGCKFSPETWVIRGIELPWSFYCWDNSYEIWHTHRQWLGASICQLSSESDKNVYILAWKHGIPTYENLIGLNLYSAKNEKFQYNTWGNNLIQFRTDMDM